MNRLLSAVNHSKLLFYLPRAAYKPSKKTPVFQLGKKSQPQAPASKPFVPETDYYNSASADHQDTELPKDELKHDHSEKSKEQVKTADKFKKRDWESKDSKDRREKPQPKKVFTFKAGVEKGIRKDLPSESLQEGTPEEEVPYISPIFPQ